MKRTDRLGWLLAAALGLAGAGGCRAEHLGRNTGEAYREALAAQRANDDDDAELPPLDAADAHRVLDAHRRVPGKDADAAAGGHGMGASSSSSSSSSGSGSGLWQGASGNITLEAK